MFKLLETFNLVGDRLDDNVVPLGFTSDPHYHHKNIIKYAERPFTSVDEMNATMIDRYNSLVGKDDLIVWCGDSFFCGRDRAREILSSLNGRKVLVRGNHDRKPKQMLAMGFECVMDGFLCDINGQRVRVSHYPYAHRNPLLPGDVRYLERRPPRHDDEILLHGHTHAHKPINGRMINVGVDAHGFKPVLLDDIISMVKIVQETCVLSSGEMIQILHEDSNH